MQNLNDPAYCPRCGTRMEVRERDGRLREVCPRCDYVLYRNPVPGVGVIVEWEGGIVLVRRKEDPGAGRWCLPAGFMEEDESAEEAAVRECLEETGLQVELTDLFGVYSFPEGPRQSGIVVFYTAKAVGGTLRAGDDAAEVGAFPLDDLPSNVAFRTHREVLARLREQSGRHARERPHRIAGVRIRPAQPADEGAILKLLPMVPASADLDEVGIQAAGLRLRETPSLTVLVAEAERTGQVVGFLALSLVPTLTGPKAWIDDLAVHPDYRRQGIGGALVEEAVRWARERGCRYLFLDTSKGNLPAQAFYQACGFEPGGVAPLRIR